MDKIKVLLSYHKPFQLFKSDILTPVHVGRKISLSLSKDTNKISQQNLEWLLDNCIGDDSGENISSENRKYCELTAQYWAWKNYDKLGNPDYIGFMHYRRHFVLNHNFNSVDKKLVAGCYVFNNMYDNYLSDIGLSDENIRNEMQNCDVLAFNPLDLRKDLPASMPKNLSPRKNYAYYDILDINDFDKAIEILKLKYPDFASATDEYINGHIMYGYNIFIMKKDIFMDYTKWLFDILFETEKHIDWTKKNIDGYRSLGNIAEQLYGIYIYKLIKDKKYIIKYQRLSLLLNAPIVEEVTPAFEKNNIPVILSSDENYVPYLTTTIQSIVSNSNPEYNYDIIVLETKIQDVYKQMITKHFAGNKNVSVRFYNIDYILNNYDDDLFYTAGHFTKATYYRFFIPQICKNYSKVIYIDCDLVVLDDISKLFNHNISGKLLGVVSEYMMQAFYRKNPHTKNYVDNIMKMKNIKNYFNAGVLLCNINEMKKFDFTNKCIVKLKEIKNPLTVDQDILNSVCEGHVSYLDFSWNYCWHPYFTCFNDMRKFLPVNDFNIWLNGITAPKIIHYTSSIKPWTDADKYLAEYWWKYAKMTPFYERIIYKNMKKNQFLPQSLLRDIFNNTKDKFSYWRYRLLSKITFGNMRKHYKNKKKELKKKLKRVKKFIKGK